MSDTPVVAPLDAYATAKPSEPTWTVQGGDPLGGPLLMVWAAFARVQAGIITSGAVDGIFEKLLKAANNNPPDTEREKDALLVRATQTELIAFDMDAYRAGHTDAEREPETSAENPLDELARLDLHDVRVRYAQLISGMAGELNEALIDLTARGFLDEEQGNTIEGTIKALQSIKNLIEPRRLFRQGD